MGCGAVTPARWISGGGWTVGWTLAYIHMKSAAPMPERTRNDPATTRPDAGPGRMTTLVMLGHVSVGSSVGIGGRSDRSLTVPGSSVRSMRSQEVRANGVPNGASARASSAMFAKRAPGSFSRHRRTAPSICGGMLARTDEGRAGSCVITPAQTAGMVSPRKGGLPVKSS